MINLKELIVDIFRRKKIFKLAINEGLDIDGDIIRYKEATYFIHVLNNTLVRIHE